MYMRKYSTEASRKRGECKHGVSLEVLCSPCLTQQKLDDEHGDAMCTLRKAYRQFRELGFPDSYFMRMAKKTVGQERKRS